MAESETNGFREFMRVFQGIPLGKMISLAVILSMVAGGFVALVIWTNRPDYQLLFSNLDAKDASRIVEKLKDKQVPFRLEDGGHAIMVPDDKVYQLRLDLASQGLPQGQDVGFDILNKLPFGTSDFIQKVKYQEALQGELERTIMQFDSVAQARVHIAPASDSPFVEPENQATASVVLRLEPGRTLDRRQLQGIINLVACAVQGLKPQNVTVVDMDGGLLSKGDDTQNDAEDTGSQFEYRRRIEKTLENRIQTMLEPVVGPNKVVAKVSADVDFQQEKISEETYDPDSAVIRSEQHQKEVESGISGLPSGSPDLKYDVYQTKGQTTSNSKKLEKENSVVNYEISKVNKQILNAVGDIKRLSAAVIIDGPYVTTTGPNGKTIRKFVPRSRKEMKEFQDIVKKAIGFDGNRGDQVSVTNIPFAIDNNTVRPVAVAQTDWMHYVRKGMKPLFNIILVALFFLFALKPFRNWLKQTKEYFGSQGLPARAGVPELGAPSSEDAGQIKKEQILDLTRTDPEKIVTVIRSWIQEGK